MIIQADTQGRHQLPCSLSSSLRPFPLHQFCTQAAGHCSLVLIWAPRPIGSSQSYVSLLSTLHFTEVILSEWIWGEGGEHSVFLCHLNMCPVIYLSTSEPLAML